MSRYADHPAGKPFPKPKQLDGFGRKAPLKPDTAARQRFRDDRKATERALGDRLLPDDGSEAP